MNIPSFSKHGESINLYINPPERIRILGGSGKIVMEFDKHIEGDKLASALNFVKSNFSDAIEYTGISDGIRGVVLLIGIWSFGMGMFLTTTLADFADPVSGKVSLFSLIMHSTLIILVSLISIWAFRYELFRPVDEPIIFDRRHRKIYRLFREVEPGLLGLFEEWPMRAAEYDWDLTEAWHTATLVTSGSNVSRYHHLRFVVRMSRDDPAIIETFTVGNAMEMGEPHVPMVWEHIRRFMEQNGPHLPPTESLRRRQQSHTLWSSMGAVGPFGAGYQDRWRKHPALSVFFHLISPFLFPFNLVWGVCHWLSYQTSFAVQWPAEVLDRIGAQPRQVKPADHPYAAPDTPAPPAQS